MFGQKVVFGFRSATCEKLTPLVERSTRKPVSLVALSVHARLMRLVETAVAVRFDGAAGGGWVVAEAVLENEECSGPLFARTR